MIAGLAAGAAIGMRVGRVPVGVGAAVALAATSAAVDVSGGHLVGNVRPLFFSGIFIFWKVTTCF